MLPEEGALHGAARVGEVADPQLHHVLASADAGRQRQQLVGQRARVPRARDALRATATPPQAQTAGGGGSDDCTAQCTVHTSHAIFTERLKRNYGELTFIAEW